MNDKKPSDKKKRINKEKKKFAKVFVSINSDKKDVIEKLIDTASFLLIMIQDMQSELLTCEDYTVETVNASQKFIKSNPLLKDYRDTVKSYQTVIKQLCDLTKDEKNPVEKDELEEFINKL